MNILIIIDSLGSGGAERSTAVLADFLYQKNLNFKIICLDRREVGIQAEMQKKGYNISFLNKGNMFSQALQISGIIKKGNFDVVHSILFRSNLRTRLAKLFTNFIHLESLVNTTYSQERLGDEKVNQKALRLYKIVDQISAKTGVNHFHSITETVKKHYVKELGLDSGKITVIPRGRKPIERANLTFCKGNPTTVNLINVGRHEFQKGQIFLLQALKILKDEGYNFHLSLLGRRGTVTKQLENYIKKEKLEEYVTLEGFKNNVQEYLLNSDLFLFPSLYEGLGGALIEAQAAGLPIACNDIPVLHEVVTDGENAKFFNVHKSASIVEAIRFFLENPEKRKKFGEKSIENFKSKFVESENNQKLLSLYRQISPKLKR